MTNYCAEMSMNGDAVDEIIIKITLFDDKIYRPSVGIKKFELLCGGNPIYACSGKYIEFINNYKSSKIYYLKIPVFNGRDSSIPLIALQYHECDLQVEFNNTNNIKDVSFMFH